MHFSTTLQRRIWAFLAATLMAGVAHADGAFPDELQIFAPWNHPNRILLTTNYGIFLSDDDGQSWTFTCEAAANPLGVQRYQEAADDSIYAAGNYQILRSADEGCTWTQSTGFNNTYQIFDTFADPADASRILVLAAYSSPVMFGVFESTDEGASFGAPVFEGTNYIGGVECAASNDAVVYLTQYFHSSDGGPDWAGVQRSDDHGATWTLMQHPEIQNTLLRIAQVSPSDPATVYFRLQPPSSITGPDALAVTHDSGQTIQVLLNAPGALSAFALGEDGTFWAADRDGNLWRSNPCTGGVDLLTGPHVRCLAERAGVLYACGDASLDGFILGASTDLGDTFQPFYVAGAPFASCAPAVAACGDGSDAGAPTSGTTGTITGSSGGAPNCSSSSSSGSTGTGSTGLASSSSSASSASSSSSSTTTTSGSGSSSGSSGSSGSTATTAGSSSSSASSSSGSSTGSSASSSSASSSGGSSGSGSTSGTAQGSSSGSASSSTSGTSGTTGAAPGRGAQHGCGCGNGEAGTAWLALLAGFAALLGRRRRARS